MILLPSSLFSFRLASARLRWLCFRCACKIIRLRYYALLLLFFYTRLYIGVGRYACAFALLLPAA